MDSSPKSWDSNHDRFLPLLALALLHDACTCTHRLHPFLVHRFVPLHCLADNQAGENFRFQTKTRTFCVLQSSLFCSCANTAMQCLHPIITFNSATRHRTARSGKYHVSQRSSHAVTPTGAKSCDYQSDGAHTMSGATTAAIGDSALGGSFGYSTTVLAAAIRAMVAAVVTASGDEDLYRATASATKGM